MLVAMATPRQATAAKTVDTTGWLSREQAVDLLGVSYWTLVSWERRGLLHPQKATRGPSLRELFVYDPNELIRVPRKHREPIPNEPGELSARVFEMLEAGKNVREIVMTTRETPAKIDELREAWLDAGGSDLVIGTSAKAELQRFLGTFATVGELVQLVAKIAGKEIDAAAADDATDAQIERGINAALDAAAATCR